MAGHWPSSFFFYWSIKALLRGLRANVSGGTQRVVPIAQDNVILPARIANHSAGFSSSCPLTGGASHVYKCNYVLDGLTAGESL